MTKIVITAEVEDTAAWEAGFRSHGDLFSNFGLASVYEYAIGEDSNVAVCVDVSDASAFLATLETPENIAAMENDGIKEGTVKVFVLDNEFSF